ncbi:MAG: SpoVR family protein, partial [Pseudomonadota bacterium]
HMFALEGSERARYYTVSGIHDLRGFKTIRHTLARNHDLSVIEPDIQVVDVDFLGDRSLFLECQMSDGARLAEKDRNAVLRHVEHLWGFDVELEEIGASPAPRREAS